MQILVTYVNETKTSQPLTNKIWTTNAPYSYSATVLSCHSRKIQLQDTYHISLTHNMIDDLHFEAMRSLKEVAHFSASSGAGLTEELFAWIFPSVWRLLRNPSRNFISVPL